MTPSLPVAAGSPPTCHRHRYRKRPHRQQSWPIVRAMSHTLSSMRTTITTDTDDEGFFNSSRHAACDDGFQLRIQNALNYRIATKCPFLIQQREEHSSHNDLTTTTSSSREDEEQHSNDLVGDDMAVLDMNEIAVGSLLGSGRFCDVYAIDRIELDANEEHRCSCISANNVLVETHRQELAHDGSRYVIKRLRDPSSLHHHHHHHHRWSLTRKQQQPPSEEQYLQAAVDLAMEAKYLANLHHENIITLRAVPGSCTNGGFLVMDRVDTTLQDCLHQWRRHSKHHHHNRFRHLHPSDQHSLVVPHNDWRTKLALACQVANALEYLHHRNLVYRDLAPSNIGLQLVDGVWQCKLLDFGLVRELPVGLRHDQEETYCMSVAGTVPYMAPCILASGEYNLKCDVFSWSIILWELLTLRQPFSDTGHGLSRDLYYRFVCEQGERPFLETIHQPRVQDLLQHGWAQDLKERWTMAQVHERVLEILQDEECAVEEAKNNNHKSNNRRHKQRSPRALLEFFAHLSHFHHHTSKKNHDHYNLRSVATADL